MSTTKEFDLSPSPEQLDEFSSITWAAPFLQSPDWAVRKRSRRAPNNEGVDTFCRETVTGNNGILTWLELYEKPKAGSKLVTKTLSLVKLGEGVSGFPGICHGGAIMTTMDEALGFNMIANELESGGLTEDMDGWDWKKLMDEGKSPQEILKGRLVTAKLDLKFLQPVLCPGVIGITTEMLENKTNKMKMRAVMKDAKGTALMQADGLWVRIGGAAKL